MQRREGRKRELALIRQKSVAGKRGQVPFYVGGKSEKRDLSPFSLGLGLTLKRTRAESSFRERHHTMALVLGDARTHLPILALIIMAFQGVTRVDYPEFLSLILECVPQ